jgi:transcription elongation factor GreA
MRTVELTVDELEVHVGSTVSVTDINAGRDQTFALVTPHMAEPGIGRLSIASPVAKALLGHRVGDLVEVNTPRGLRPLMIAAIA